MAIKPPTIPFKKIKGVDVSLSRVQDNIQESLQGLKKTIVNRESICPIGARVFWNSSLVPNVPSLPTGWVQCNGQVLIDEESLLNGQTMPLEAGRIIRVK